MANLSITEADVGAVNPADSDRLCLPADVATLKAGDAVKINTSTGEFTAANASSAPEARVYGVLADSATRVGSMVTAIRRGTVALGAALDGIAFDGAVYLSDTDLLLADGAGTVNTVVGRVIPKFAGSDTPSKLLKVEL